MTPTQSRTQECRYNYNAITMPTSRHAAIIPPRPPASHIRRLTLAIGLVSCQVEDGLVVVLVVAATSITLFFDLCDGTVHGIIACRATDGHNNQPKSG